MNKKIFIQYFIVIISIVSIGTGVWYYTTQTNTFYIKSSADTSTVFDTNNLSPLTALINTSKPFALAYSSFILGNYVSSLSSYKEALTIATSTAQKAIIKYDISNMLFYTGDTITAVNMLLKIANTTAYPSYIRANSVQTMGRIFYSTLDTEITQVIFRKPPFKALFVENNTKLSYKNLFKYGASLSALPVTELYIANMNAEHIGALYKEGATATFSDVISEMKTIKDSLALVGITLSSTTPEQPGVFPPVTLLRKAVTIGTLSHTGLAPVSYAERLFKISMDEYNQFGNATSTGIDAMARYQYSAFLATNYGSARSSDIQNVMAPLYTEMSYTKSPIASFFKNGNSSMASQIGVKRKIQKIADNDPNFKAYLRTLGWTNIELAP